MNSPESHILIIFGASGDLTKRKLIPALFALEQQQLLPQNYAVLGVGRTEMDDQSFRDRLAEELPEFLDSEEYAQEELNNFLRKLHYVAFNTRDTEAYSHLRDKAEALHNERNIPPNLIFYLATPPSLYTTVAHGLAKFDMNRQHEGSWSRIIIEKPFGYDLQSSRTLTRELQRVFGEDQIYRIDHYLGKETVQNIMVTRFSNGIFEPLWNRNYIDHVEITSAESIGVEGRGGYYDHSGALRDMLQNHLLQLVAIIAMEPPAVNSPTAIRNETLKVLQALRPFSDKDLDTRVIRGQYLESTIMGKHLKSYRDEEGVPPDSRTETYIAAKLYIENWRWGGVPFYIRSGKRLPTRVTEAVIHFKPTPHGLFCPEDEGEQTNNKLVIRIQPDEGILLKFGMKVPGAGFRVQEVGMDFHYSDLLNTKIPEAYQRLLLDAMMGDATLYARGDAVDEAWKFVDPVLKHWQNHPDRLLHGYPSGTWGPRVADELIEGEKTTWRYPCKNLTNDGIYCEL